MLIEVGKEKKRIKRDMLATRRLGFLATALFRQIKSVNNVTLVGVVHDIQTGYVYEDPVTQFTLTTTALDTAGGEDGCVVEKDHHTVRCFGEVFAGEVKAKIKEGAVLCVNGKLRMNPQLEPQCGKHFYFPFIHVQPPTGQVTVISSDRRKAPPTAESSDAEIAEKSEPEASDSKDNSS